MKRLSHERSLHPSLMVVVLAGLVGTFAACGGGSRETQLSWCARHQDDVGRVALELGLMQPGQRHEDWKTSDGEYDRACAAAWEAADRGVRTDLPPAS